MANLDKNFGLYNNVDKKRRFDEPKAETDGTSRLLRSNRKH